MNENYIKRLSESKEIIDSMPWEDKKFYGNFLAQTYYFVCHSTRLLARAASHFGVDNERLYRRFVNHMSEEDRHELLAKKDLEQLGFSIEDFPELSETRTFWESQYYKIDQSKGTSLLGYILYLEAIAVNCFERCYDVISKEYGNKCVNFIRVHVNEDPEHLEHAIEEINAFEGAQLADIWQNFEQSADIYEQILFKSLKMRDSQKIAA
jgi:hypothetical protein